MRNAVDIWIKFTKFFLTYLILKLVFHLRVFSYEATFVVRKQYKGLDPTFFTLKKVINQGEFSKKSLCTKKFVSEKPAEPAKLTGAK